jgi:hypothetical protein
MEGGVMQKSQPLATGLAFLFLLLLLAGLAARFWASNQASLFTGPTHIAAGKDYVYVFSAGDIHRLTHAGEWISVIPPGDTGLNDHPIDLRVSPDGQLLIAEQRPAAIRLCDVDPWICHPIGMAAEPVVERQFKVLPGVLPNKLLLTDARGDTLWSLNEAGGVPHKLVPDGTLAGPNDLALDGDGNLWVADTDHRRIVELLPSGDGLYVLGRSHSAVNALTVGERYYPMMLALAQDGRWWVAQAAEFSKPFADLVIYDPEEGVRELIDLPAGAYPVDLVSVGDVVLVTDLERHVVYQVDNDTLEVGEFGDETFRQHLGQIQDKRGYYEYLGALSLAAVVLFGVLMVLAAIRATPKGQRWTQPPAVFDLANAPQNVPRTRGVYWLERDAKIERSLKWLEHLGFILFILMVAAALALFLWVRIQAGPDPATEQVSRINELGLILLLSCLLGALVIPLIRLSTKALKRRLGTDGKRVYIRLPEGRELAVEPSQLAYTNRAILYRQYTLPLQGAKQQPIYALGEVETWLAPLLRQSQKLTEMQAIKYQWKNRFSAGRPWRP